MKFITMSDGTIQFVMRGLPPQEVPGYEVNPGDPYVFHPILTPCAARVYKQLNDSDCCPAGKNVRHCTKFGYYQMHSSTCQDCASRGNHVPVEIGIDKLKE